MSYFKAKMHQIQFRLGLRPRPRWGNWQRSPDPVAECKGTTSKGREGTPGSSLHPWREILDKTLLLGVKDGPYHACALSSVTAS